MILISEARQSATFTEKQKTFSLLSNMLHFPKFSPIYTGGPTTLQMNSQIYLTGVFKKNSMAESPEM